MRCISYSLRIKASSVKLVLVMDEKAPRRTDPLVARIFSGPSTPASDRFLLRVVSRL